MVSRASIALLCLLAAALAPVAFATDCNSFPHKRTIRVSNSNSLDKAIRGARPGDLILMAPGKYSNTIRGSNYRHTYFENKHGAKGAPITLCGPASAVLEDRSAGNTPVMLVLKSSYINLAGFTIQGGQKGLVIQYSSHNLINGLTIRNTGAEGIHIQYKSSYNIVTRCSITNTGRRNRGVGEGIYLGSDDKRGRDPCYRNHILYNKIGPGVTAEMIDIKQNSANAIIKGNILDGRDLCNCNSATSLINVKGNNYKILGNIGKNSGEHMFKVSQTQRGQGQGNYFSGNKCAGGLRSGYKCINVPEGYGGNRVSCNQRSINVRCAGK